MIDNLVEQLGVCRESHVLLLHSRVDEGRLLFFGLSAPVVLVGTFALPGLPAVFYLNVHADALLQDEFDPGLSDTLAERFRKPRAEGKFAFTMLRRENVCEENCTSSVGTHGGLLVNICSPQKY